MSSLLGDWVGPVATMVSVVSFLPQLVKSWRSKSTHDLSYATWVLFCLGEGLWFVYGLTAEAAWMSVATGVTVALSLAIILLKHLYGDDARRFVPITQELRQVVSDSEVASHQMLTAAETIESILGDLRGSSDPRVRTKVADALAHAATTIYEACNFQDISGQRIDRVVRTFEVIEARNPRIREIWEKTQAGKPTRPGHDPQAFGPALSGERQAGQADIDKLFD